MVFDNPRNKGILFVILNTILWSGNYVVGRIIIGEIPPITFNSLRWLVTVELSPTKRRYCTSSSSAKNSFR